MKVLRFRFYLIFAVLLIALLAILVFSFSAGQESDGDAGLASGTQSADLSKVVSVIDQVNKSADIDKATISSSTIEAIAQTYAKDGDADNNVSSDYAPATADHASRGYTALAEAVAAGNAVEVSSESMNYSATEVMVTIKDQNADPDNLFRLEQEVSILSGGRGQAVARRLSTDSNGDVIVLITLPENVTVDAALLAIANDSDVLFVQPNRIYVADN